MANDPGHLNKSDAIKTSAYNSSRIHNLLALLENTQLQIRDPEISRFGNLENHAALLFTRVKRATSSQRHHNRLRTRGCWSPLVKASLAMLAPNLTDKDRVAIVVCAGAAGLVLPSTAGQSLSPTTPGRHRSWDSLQPSRNSACCCATANTKVRRRSPGWRG
jgi:hypothetical protein